MDEVRFKDAALAELARLRSRWIMTEAANIMEATNKPRSFAMIAAWRTWRLLDALSQGTVYFRYQKRDGETRMAQSTLAKGQDGRARAGGRGAAEAAVFFFGKNKSKRKKKKQRKSPPP